MKSTNWNTGVQHIREGLGMSAPAARDMRFRIILRSGQHIMGKAEPVSETLLAVTESASAFSYGINKDARVIIAFEDIAAFHAV